MVGLFGGDLTAFLEDCAAAEDGCDVADYAGLSGWAIGIEWTTEVAISNPYAFYSVIFEDQSIFARVYFEDQENYLNSGTFDGDVAAGAPVRADVTLDYETFDPQVGGEGWLG